MTCFCFYVTCDVGASPEVRNFSSLTGRCLFSLDRHRNEDRQFLIFTDFEVSFQDHTGFSDTVATIRATHDNLVRQRTAFAKHQPDKLGFNGRHLGSRIRCETWTGKINVLYTVSCLSVFSTSEAKK